VQWVRSWTSAISDHFVEIEYLRRLFLPEQTFVGASGASV
jgi:hypothetical protein